MFTYEIEELFTAGECMEIIRLAQVEPTASGGLVGGKPLCDIRRATISWLDDVGTAAWVMERITGAVARANRDAFEFDISQFQEKLQVAVYDEGDNGFYDWHTDVGEGPIAQFRKVTVVTQLSPPDAYEGGDLEINLGNRLLTASKAQGSATLFAGFLLHRVVPVTTGCRQSLTCWCHGPRFR